MIYTQCVIKITRLQANPVPSLQGDNKVRRGNKTGLYYAGLLKAAKRFKRVLITLRPQLKVGTEYPRSHSHYTLVFLYQIFPDFSQNVVDLMCSFI